ncbi:MAG: fibronectin type III domain-containing protein [Chitinophagales bacterium]
MKKKKAILNLSNATNTDAINKANLIVSKMTNNAAFPSPMPALSLLSNNAAILTKKMTEQKDAFKTYQQKTQEVNDAYDNLIEVMKEEANYVSIASGGDEAAIISAGFDVRKPNTPRGLLPAPKNMRIMEGANDGEVMVKWNKVSGAKSFIIEKTDTPDDKGSWKFVMVVTDTQCKLINLPSGSKIWLRVAAINAAGKGAYSNPAAKTVP